MTKRLNELFDIDEDGIFKIMTTIPGFDIWDDDAAEMMDVEFLTNHSGGKIISPLVEAFVGEDGQISAANKYKLAYCIYKKFKANWNYLAKYSELDYDPIENYSMEEVETPNITKQTDSKQNFKTTTTDHSETNSSDANNEKTYGFNSSNPVPVNKNDGSTENEANGNSTTSGSWDDNKSNTVETETGTRTLTRRGNIGTLTAADMLKGDSGFWTGWNFINIVFRNADDLLVIDIY